MHGIGKVRSGWETHSGCTGKQAPASPLIAQIHSGKAENRGRYGIIDVRIPQASQPAKSTGEQKNCIPVLLMVTDLSACGRGEGQASPAIGSWIRKQTPSSRFSAQQSPPWASTAARTMASPRPVPPLSRLRDLPAR